MPSRSSRTQGTRRNSVSAQNRQENNRKGASRKLSSQSRSNAGRRSTQSRTR